MSFHDFRQQSLEPLAELYIGNHRVERLTPLLVSSVFCGVTWGVLGLQFMRWCVSSTVRQQQHWSVNALICYLMLASTAYLALFSTWISYFFAYNFGSFAAAFDLTYTSWLFLLATAFIHVPCEMFYIHRVYKLSGKNKLVGLTITGMCTGILASGIAIKVLMPDWATGLTSLQSFFIKFWIALGTVTDLAVAGLITFYLVRGNSARFASASLAQKCFMLISEAQLPPTLLSIGLLGLIMGAPSSAITNLWLGFPLVFPITLLSSVDSRRAIRDGVEAEAQSGDRRDSVKSISSVASEKLQIPPAEARGSFSLAPFPSISIRRASQAVANFASPVTVPALSGVRRASVFLGVLPPLPAQPKKKKRSFPFKKRTKAFEPEEAREYHPTSLAYPLKDDAAPMGTTLSPQSLYRVHSLAPLDEEPSLSITFGQSSAHLETPLEHDMSTNDMNGPALVDPFSNGNSDPFAAHRTTPSPVGRPSMADVLEAHEIFEMPQTPEMLSPRSGSSPCVGDEECEREAKF